MPSPIPTWERVVWVLHLFCISAEMAWLILPHRVLHSPARLPFQTMQITRIKSPKPIIITFAIFTPYLSLYLCRVQSGTYRFKAWFANSMPKGNQRGDLVEDKKILHLSSHYVASGFPILNAAFSALAFCCASYCTRHSCSSCFLHILCTSYAFS